MFFTKLAHVSCKIFFVLALINLGVGLLAAFNPSMQGRIIAGSSGEHIDQSLRYLVITVAIGVLAEISKTLASANREEISDRSTVEDAT